MSTELTTAFEKVQVGTPTTPKEKFILECTGKTGGFGFPSFTTAERDALWLTADFPNTDWMGSTIYNSTVERIQFNTGSAWLSFEAGAAPVATTAFIKQYADDASYVTANGAAVNGSIYYNTTIGEIRGYSAGAWSNYLTNVDTTGVVENDVLVMNDSNEFVPEAKALFNTPLTIPVVSSEPATPGAGFVVLWADDNKTIKAKYETGEVVEMLRQYDVIDFLDTPLMEASSIDYTAVAYYTVVASLADAVKAVQIFDTAGINLGWYDGSNNLLFVSGPGTNETTAVEIAAGTTIKVRPLAAASAAFAGNYTVNFLG